MFRRIVSVLNVAAAIRLLLPPKFKMQAVHELINCRIKPDRVPYNFCSTRSMFPPCANLQSTAEMPGVKMRFAGPEDQAICTPECTWSQLSDPIRWHNSPHFTEIACDDCTASQIYIVKEDGIHLSKSYLYRLGAILPAHKKTRLCE
jgi:hypothetical protein